MEVSCGHYSGYSALRFNRDIIVSHRLPPYKKKELSGCQNISRWMSYRLNYKALWLYYKTKTFIIVMLLVVLQAEVLIMV